MNKTRIIILIVSVFLAAAAAVTGVFLIKRNTSAKHAENGEESTTVTESAEEDSRVSSETEAVKITESSDEEDVFEDEEHLRSKVFEIINYSDTSIMTDSPLVNFRGTSSPFYPLTYNGNKIETADNGDFSVDIDLKRGLNKITFEHKDEKYEYNVTYNVNIIENVSPSETISVPSGMSIDIYATALSGSDLRVNFNGQTVRMSAAEDDGDEEFVNPAGFSTYKATVKAPNVSSETNTGQFKVTATNIYADKRDISLQRNAQGFAQARRHFLQKIDCRIVVSALKAGNVGLRGAHSLREFLLGNVRFSCNALLTKTGHAKRMRIQKEEKVGEIVFIPKTTQRKTFATMPILHGNIKTAKAGKEISCFV